MPLGLKPTCSVCKTTSSSMWKKGPQGEILCHHCTGRGGAGGGGSGSGAAGGTGGSGGGGGFGAATFASTSAAPPQSNGGGGGKQSKQEIHRRSARLRNTKYKSAPAAEKKVSTKGKGRRHIFKLKNPIKAPESVSTIITAESIFYKGVYYQIGDVVSVIDEQDGKPYYAQIRGFIQDQYCEKSAALTWLIPTLSSPRDQFDPASYIIEGTQGHLTYCCYSHPRVKFGSSWSSSPHFKSIFHSSPPALLAPVPDTEARALHRLFSGLPQLCKTSPRTQEGRRENSSALTTYTDLPPSSTARAHSLTEVRIKRGRTIFTTVTGVGGDQPYSTLAPVSAPDDTDLCPQLLSLFLGEFWVSLLRGCSQHGRS